MQDEAKLKPNKTYKEERRRRSSFGYLNFLDDDLRNKVLGKANIKS